MSRLGNEGKGSAARWTAVLSTTAGLLVLGCALTSKSEPMVPRYFSPERFDVPEKPAVPAVKLAGELRIGHVNAASYLDGRMVFRDSAFELGYYQEKRWTEAPEEYLRRRLERVLFEERGLRHVVSGGAPTLEVELTAFEEIRKPKRIVRVQVTVRLQEGRLVRWEETLTVDKPMGEVHKDALADEMVEALGAALAAVVHQIADRVTHELAAKPATPPTP